MRYLLKQTELKQIEPSTGGTTRMKNTRMKNTHKKSPLVCVLDARGSQCPEILSASNFQVPRISRSLNFLKNFQNSKPLKLFTINQIYYK